MFGGTAALPLVESVKVLKLEEDDTLVLSTERHMSAETVARLRETMEAHFPGRKVLVMEGGLKLEVLKSSK